jgi:hypothetical protein
MCTRVEYELACRFRAISAVAEAMENGFAPCRAVEIACTVENDASHWEVSIAATGKNKWPTSSA